MEVDTAHRLAAARGLLRRLEDRATGARPVAEPGADGRVLPVAAPLAALLPGGGLRRGATVAVARAPGATSLMLALLAEASAGGAWAGVVGRPDLGLVAAAEAGVALERLALVPYPGADLVAVTAALLDGLDLVAWRAGGRSTAATGSGWPPGPGSGARCCCRSGRGRGRTWSWPASRGGGGAWAPGRATIGRLCARRVRVQLRGRGVAPAGRSARLLLPGPAAGSPRRRGSSGVGRAA